VSGTFLEMVPDTFSTPRLRLSVDRGMPYGADEWTQQTASALGLECTLRSRGRPRAQAKEEGVEKLGADLWA
jgi:hypothetical protein